MNVLHSSCFESTNGIDRQTDGYHKKTHFCWANANTHVIKRLTVNFDTTGQYINFSVQIFEISLRLASRDLQTFAILNDFKCYLWNGLSNQLHADSTPCPKKNM